MSDRMNCLETLDSFSIAGGEMCAYFRTIEEATGFDTKTVRAHIRSLAAEGLAEYYNALWSEDGHPAGAGYCITDKGRDLLHVGEKK